MARNRGRDRRKGSHISKFDPGRRRFLTGVAGAASAAVLPGCGSSTSLGTSALPDPAQTGIDHIIVVMMENRSFDHFLGWLPGADGKQAGLAYRDRYGRRHRTHHLTTYASCGHTDPDHSYEGGRVELDRGRNDGWLRAAENDLLAIGYYDKS